MIGPGDLESRHSPRVWASCSGSKSHISIDFTGVRFRPSPPNEEWMKTVNELIGGDSWILDGNFSGTCR